MTWSNLKSLFEYDLWANTQWLQYLEKSDVEDVDRAVFHHIFSAQVVWLLRLQGTPPTNFPTLDPTLSEISRIHQEWIALLDGEDYELTFRRMDGEEMTRWLSAIVLHVINHGTYHRGELRGLAKAAGRTDFPETDFLIYASQANLGSLIGTQ